MDESGALWLVIALNPHGREHKGRQYLTGKSNRHLCLINVYGLVIVKSTELIRHFKWEDVTFSFIWAPRDGCCPEATQQPCVDRHGGLPFWVMQSYYLELQLLHTHSLNVLLFLGLIFLSSNIQLSMGNSSTQTICWWGFQMWRQEGRTSWKLLNYKNILTTHTAWPMYKTAPGRNYAYLY